MSNIFDPNRRKFPRAIYPCQLTIWLNDGDMEVIMTETNNVGAGGVSIHLHRRLSPGVKVDVKIDFTQASIPFKCRGTIVRCVEVDAHTSEIGIEFDGLDQVKQSFLQGKISELIDKEEHGK